MSRQSQPGTDGRMNRTVRSRAAICDACLDLIGEGILQPSAEQVAERAGLSRRSVFNHFKDLGELYDAVLEVGMERCAPLLVVVDAGLPIAQRVEFWTRARADFLEATGPFTRALTAQALALPTRKQAMRVSKEALALQQRDVERVFGKKLQGLPRNDRSEILEAISAATSPLLWEHLRHSRGLSAARARGVLKRSVLSLLGTTHALGTTHSEGGAEGDR